MNSAVTDTQTLLNAIKGTVKEELMDRYSPSNMSTDENNPAENLPEIDSVNRTKKTEDTQSRRSSNDSRSDEGSNISSKGSIISSNKETVEKIDIKPEKATTNRILKRKKRKFDWEVIIVNEDLVNDENLEEKIEVKECKYKLTVSNFPTHWGEKELKEFILNSHGPVDMFYMSIDKRHYFVGTIQLHFSTKEDWKKAWDEFNGKCADDQRIFAHVDDFMDSDSDTESAEPPIKKIRENTEPEDNSKSDIDVWETDPKGLYGLKPEFLQTLGITPPIDRWVHVSNVRCDKNELKEVMELAGEVLMCTVSFFAANVKYAKVMYSHPLEAVQAISMLNDQELYGAKLKIVMDHLDSNLTQVLPKGLKSVGPGLGVMGVHLRDVVRQYERYVKGFNSGVNKEFFLEIDGHNYCKTVPRNRPRNSSQGHVTKSSNLMPLRQNPIPQPVPPASYAGNYRPNGPINYGPQTNPGPMGHPVIPSHMCPMPNPGPSGPMVPNIPLNCPVGPVRPIGPVCPPRQMGSNIPVNGPRPVGPVTAPIGPVPGNPGVGPRGPVGANAGHSPSSSPGPKSTLPVQQPQEHVTVELTNVPWSRLSQPRDLNQVYSQVELPLSTTFPLLCDKMAQCGAVISLQLGAPGCAVVQFANRMSAEKCYKQYNQCLVMGNVIEVKFL